MKKRKVQIREYSSKVLEGLPPTAENALFVAADRLSGHYNAPVLRCSKNRQGDVVISTSSFVGVIDVSDELTLEIIPKIYESNDTASLKNLFYMLSYSGQFNIPSKNLSALEKYNGSFFEALVGLFAEELLAKVQNSAHHEYVTQKSNRTYLRGKLSMADHLKTNGLLANKFYTEVDAFMDNNPLNQILKYTTKGLFKLTAQPANKKRLRQCLALLDGVDDVRVTRTQVKDIQVNRLNRRFENLIMLAELFVNNQTLIAKSGQHESWTMLIDMNALFESFITTALKRGLSGGHYTILAQGPQKKFVRNVQQDRAVFTMKPDVSIVRYGRVVQIADTKYKLLATDDSKYGVSQSDLYQMFAYSQRYRVSDITLVYPRTNNAQPHTLELPNSVNVHVRTVGLSRDIRKEIASIEQEVVALFSNLAT